MKFQSYYSSSTANFYTVTAANGQRILVECGCTWKKLQKALGCDLSNIVGCLLTHEHKDHSKAIEDVLQAGIDVYASAGTFEALSVVHRKAHAIDVLKGIKIADTFRIFPFEVNHDAAQTFGFIVQADGESLLFVTDTSHIKQKFGLAFSIITVCCGYDGAVLRDRVERGSINEEFAKRLLDSHMEKEVTKSYIRDCCCTDKCTEIWLLHMSGNNIDQKKTREEFEAEFFIKTYIAGQKIKAS